MNDRTRRKGWGLQAGGVAAIALVLSVTGCTSLPWQGAPVVSAEGSGRAGGATHVVAKGDTMYSIAWRNGLDYRKVAAMNNIPPPYTIRPGQVINLGLPVPAAADPVPPGPRPPKAASTVETAELAAAPAQTTAPSVARPLPSAAVDPAPVVQQPAPAKAPRKGPWQWPVEGAVVQGYARSDPQRKGIRITGRMDQPVWAAADGEVVYSGDGLKGYGQLVILKHTNGYLSAYGFNRGLLVKEGDRVTGGMQIARMGEDDSGRPILHFEIRRDDGQPVDPEGLLPKR